MHNARVLAVLLLGLVCYANASARDAAADARQHAEEGVGYAHQGDFTRAEAELRQAVQLAPNDASYLTSLGGILGMQGKLAEANVFFKRAVQVDPANAAALRNLAANEWRLGDFKEAQTHLERLLHTEPHDKVATLLLGMVFENQHQYARAAELLAEVPELVQQRAESTAALASAYYHTGQRDRAHTILEPLLTKQFPPEGVFAAAGVAAQAGDCSIAEKLFLSIRASYPDAAAVEYNLALIEFRTGRVAESQKRLLALTGSAHANSEVYNLLGWCYHKQNQPDEAVHAFDEAIRLRPSEQANYLDLITILLSNQRLSAALAVARKTVDAFPASESAYCAKGKAELKLNQFTDAAESYRRAAQLNPKSLEAQLGLASAQWSAGMRSGAETRFQALLKEHPRDAAVYEAYGSSLLNSAIDDATLTRASALLTKAVELDSSSSPEAHFELGMLELKKSTAGASDSSLLKAREQLEAAARLGLNDSKLHYSLARVYRRFGLENDAAKEMRLYERTKAAEDGRP